MKQMELVYQIMEQENINEESAIKYIISNIMKNNGIPEEEAVKAFFKLSDERHNKIGKEIINVYLFDKYPVEKPKAIVNIAPPASGKTGLNGFSANEFVDNNVVIINSDELKPYHPYIDVIAKYYPQYYTKVTDQESNTWTSDLFDTALAQGYNVIFEGTGKNARILNTIKEKMKGYDVTVRGMAVNEMNCLISILERYEGQVQTKGWGRLVVIDHFLETYGNMPETIDEIEKSRIVNSVEVYKRGERVNKPRKIYDSNDRKNGRFPNAKFAVLGTRQEDEEVANAYFEEKKEKLMKSLNRENVSDAEKIIINRIVRLNENYNEKKTAIR